ncbi:MAG: abortive infection system antitoxin AbiGi family protein [Oligoflexales bacterium]
MKIDKNQLIQQRGDLSDFLIHLTRSGRIKRFKELYSLEKDDVSTVSARESVISIIQNRRIEARSPFGYFNFKVPMQRGNSTLNSNSKIKREWLRAVCLTETPLDHIHLQTKNIIGRSLHFEPYGLAFKEAVIAKAGGNPVSYIHTDNASHRSTFDAMATSNDCSKFRSLFPLIEGFGPPWFRNSYGPNEIDFRWEREWRITGDFSFKLDDIAFGLCPEAEIKTFESLVNRQIPFVDPTADINHIKQKLRKCPHLRFIK